MGRELSDVFKAKTRADKRKVLDKFDISKEDKNKFLNNIEDKSSGESGGDSNIEYLDVSGFGMADDDSPSDELLNIVNAATSIKVDLGPEGQAVLTGGQFVMFSQIFGNGLYGMTKAVFIDYDLITAIPGRTMTVKEMLLGNFTQEQLDAIPRITKEQFYSLE